MAIAAALFVLPAKPLPPPLVFTFPSGSAAASPTFRSPFFIQRTRTSSTHTLISLGRSKSSKRIINFSVSAFFNPLEGQPIIKDALKEPVAFMGGMFAGILRLDLKEEPLREWISRTADASRVAEDGEEDGSEGEEKEKAGGAPQQIEIE